MLLNIEQYIAQMGKILLDFGKILLTFVIKEFLLVMIYHLNKQ
ncbi:hypothetical protein SKA34_05705 [Photobacterium sp. SKA34]|nr:hypothetical protein SKA34_05705 [Photobacterium sp. SKA34]